MKIARASTLVTIALDLCVGRLQFRQERSRPSGHFGGPKTREVKRPSLYSRELLIVALNSCCRCCSLDALVSLLIPSEAPVVSLQAHALHPVSYVQQGEG